MLKKLLKILLKWLLTSLQDGKITKEEGRALLKDVMLEVKTKDNKKEDKKEDK